MPGQASAVTTEMLTVFALVALALLLFAWERMRIDATSVLIMALLMVTGILEPSEALAGFSNVATVTVAAMFVLSAALRQTGALNSVGDLLSRLGRRSPWLALVAMMGVVGVVSAFINNTAAVAILIPVVIQLARDIGWSPSKLLMPLSFASMFGGVCTLIGTSTNLLVDSIAVEEGLEGFAMFDFAPLGLALFAVGAVYLFATIRWIPERRAGSGQELTERFEVAPYLTLVRLDAGSTCVGETLGDNSLTRDLGIEVIDVHRDGQDLPGTARRLQLEAGDVLHVRADAPVLQRLLDRDDVTVVPPTGDAMDDEIETQQDALVEIVISPDSQLGGRTVGALNLPGRHGAQALAIRQHGELQHDLTRVELRGGDSLLLKIDRERLGELQEQEDFFVASEVVVPHLRRGRMPAALAIIVAVVATAALGVVPIVVSAVTGGLAMVAIGALTAEEAYDAINWKVVFLLAGVLPLGVALEQTGGATYVADLVVRNTATLGPAAVLGGFFLLTQLLTSVISNNASAVLMAPIAVGAAQSLGVAPRPFLFAVTVAASMSFLTPVGYQTNTMIYGPGHYRFTDFTRIGGPLTLLVAAVATLLIPRIWAF